MKRARFTVILTILSSCSSAPMDYMEACKQITNEDSASMATCCNYLAPFTNETMETCGKKEALGTLSEEFECIQDCLFSSDRVMGADNKFDPTAWKEHAMNTVSGDWREVIANSASDCEGFKRVLGSSMEKKCPTSGSDVFFNCMGIEWYLNCPESAKTSSESCEASRKKLTSCFGSLLHNS